MSTEVGTAYSQVNIDAGLADLVSPLSVSEFLARHWTREFLHVPGHPDKFDSLFSWDVLNEVLECHRFGRSRLRIVREGRSVDPAVYQLPSKDQTCSVRAREVSKLLRDGATLIVNAIDECHRPLRALVVQMEQLFKFNVNVNLYVGFGHDRGFLQHWDPQETLILQVAGTKAWNVWAPTRHWPLQPDVQDAPKPEADAIWDGQLTQGSLFYLPRGWWHVARPLDEPCMHLTVTVNTRTGVDLALWLVKRLRLADVVRQDLPTAMNATAQEQYYAALQQMIVESMASVNFGHAAKEFLRGEVTERPQFALPQL